MNNQKQFQAKMKDIGDASSKFYELLEIKEKSSSNTELVDNINRAKEVLLGELDALKNYIDSYRQNSK